MDPSSSAIYPLSFFETAKNTIISGEIESFVSTLLPARVLFIYAGAKDCGHKKCVRVRRGEFFRVIM